MKKIQSLILALPLIVAAALASCSDDNIEPLAPQPGAQNTVTFTASIPETRVAYAVSGDNAIKCTWDDNDRGKIVVFQETKDKGTEIVVNTFEFIIEEINDRRNKWRRSHACIHRQVVSIQW